MCAIATKEQERFLGFWSVTSTDGKTFLEDILREFDLLISMLLAQRYDGAAIMKGRYSNLATRVTAIEGRAVYNTVILT